MRNKYNRISIRNINYAIILIFCAVLCGFTYAQQSPSIQSGVTFQWLDTQPTINDPATIKSITVNGLEYNTFVVPSSYELTRLGPDGHTPNRIRQNGGNVGSNSSSTNWETNAISAFQDKDLNHYFTSNPNGRPICSDFTAVETTDAQKQTINYSPPIPANDGGILAVTERGGNNCFYVEIWGIPVMGGPEQKLGSTFVRNSGDYRGCTFGVPNPGSDYWKSGRCNDSGQTIGIGLFYLNDIAPTGSKITKISFVATTKDHGDGKFFILQKYAVDQQNFNCINSTFSSSINLEDNLPVNSTYSIVSGPSVPGQSFSFNPDGSYTYDPPLDYTGDVTFEYQVCLPAPNSDVCDTATVTINFIALPDEPELEVSCSSSDNYTISVTKPIGDDFEYSINNGVFQASPNFTNISEGQYNITIRNKFTLCEIDYPANPVSLYALSVTGNVANVSCKSEDTGAINISASGGTSPYTYQWSNTSTSEDLSDMLAGTYTVIVTDANGCSVSDSFTINEPAKELKSTISATDVLCFGDKTGALDFNVTGGTAPYTYSWNNGATSEDLTEVFAGTYEVIATDANGCNISNQVTIEEPINPLSLTLSIVSATTINSCNGGTATAIVSGGTTPYTYQWAASTNNQTTATATNLPAGNHSVKVIDSNGCEIIQNVQISCIDDCDTEITIETTTNVLCFGESSGGASVSASSVINPTATYTFNWSNGQSDTGVISSSISNVIAGNYTVSVTMDESICDPVVQSIDISQPLENLSASITAQTDIICSGLGSVIIEGVGGLPPYSYSSDGATNIQTNGIFNDLIAGSYIFDIYDANGCNFKITTDILSNCTDAIADINNTYVNQPVSGNVLTNDEDFVGDNQTVTANTNPANGAVVINPDGSYTYTPNPEFIGQDSFEYTICDDGNPQACDTATVYIEVLPEGGPENEAPIANADTATTAEATPIDIVVLANDFDPDGDPITITATTNPTNGTVTVNLDGTITYTPNPGFTGEDTFTYTICDDGNPQLCDTATVTVTVQDANTPNTTNANDDAYNVNPTSILTGNVLVNDNDIEGDTQTVTTTTVTTTNGVTVNIDSNTGTFAYTPNQGYTGTDSFIYTICDNGNPQACDTATVYITVDGVAGLSIAKSVLTTTNDCVSSGDTITYIFTLTNSGSVLINSITIIDDLLGGDITATLTLTGDNGDTILDPTETWVFTAQDYTITQADVDSGNITNNVTANGLEPNGTTTVQATDTYIIDANNPDITLCNDGGIALIKTGIFNNDNGNDCTEIDETITYTFTVNNTGDVALGNVNITDPLLENAAPVVSINFISGDTDTDNQLDPIETWIYNATYLVTQIDIDATEVINTATVTAIEVANNTSVSATSQTITELIEDTTPPDTSSCAVLDASIECSGVDNETVANDWNATNILALENCATDACDNNFTVTSNYDFTNLISSCGAGGTITVVYTLTDATGNISTYTAILTLEDTTGPDLLACTIVNETIECSSDNETMAIAWNASNIAALETCGTDTCDIDPTNLVTSDFDFANLVPTCGVGGTITVVYSVADDCGNISTLNAILTIEDTTPPSFTVPVDITIECDVDITDLNLTGDVTDEAHNCSTIALNAIYTDSVAGGSCTNESIITRTWSLTDECNNTTTFVQTITVEDTTAPTFNETLPADTNAECDNVPTAETLTASDNCGTANVSFTEEITNGTCVGDYIIVRTWTATDSCNNDNIHIQIITVEDNTAPTVVTAFDENITVACDNIPVKPDLVFEDSCSTNISVSFNEVSTQVNEFEDYQIIRTWTVIDDCSNEALFNQTINVEIGNIITVTDAERCVLDIEFDLFELLSGDFDMNGTWSVVAGNAPLNGSFFDPSSTVANGVYTFMYTISDGPCPREVEVNVTIDDDCLVLPCSSEDNILISKTVTANGDFVNDVFTVELIEECGFVIELQIFNRWGAEIYKSNNYQNDWGGETHSSSVGNSGKVPTGTYYYIINLKNSGLAPFTGPIYVATN